MATLVRAEVSRSTALRAVVLLMLVAAFAHFNRISMPVAGAGPLIHQEGISPTSMGFIYSGFLLCYTLAMLPGGWFIDHFGPKVALAVLCGASTVFVALTGLTGLLATGPAMLWAALMVVRCVMGVFNAPLHPASAHMVGHAAPPSQASFSNGLVTFAACVGIASTYFVFGTLMDQLGWPVAFFVSSAVTLGVFLVWVALAPQLSANASFATPLPRSEAHVVREPDPRVYPVSAETGLVPGSTRGLTDVPPTPSEFSPSVTAPEVASGRRALSGGSLYLHPGLICLTLSYAALGYFQYLFFYWVEFYFKDVVQLSAETSRLYSTLVTFANGVGMVLGGWLADRAPTWSPSRGLVLVPAVGMFASGVFLLGGLLTSDHLVALLCFIAAMAAIGACEGPCWTISVLLGGNRGGTAAALMNTGGNAGGLLAPVVTPILSSYVGWQGGMGVASLVAFVGAILWVGIDPRDGRDVAAPDSRA